MTTEEATQLLAYMSEDPVRATQRRAGPPASLAPPATLIRPTQRENERSDDDPLKPRFAELTSSHHSVARFAALVIAEVLPSELFGSPQNQKTFSECAGSCPSRADSSQSAQSTSEQVVAIRSRCTLHFKDGVSTTANGSLRPRARAGRSESQPAMRRSDRICCTR